MRVGGRAPAGTAGQGGTWSPAVHPQGAMQAPDLVYKQLMKQGGGGLGGCPSLGGWVKSLGPPL